MNFHDDDDVDDAQVNDNLDDDDDEAEVYDDVDDAQVDDDVEEAYTNALSLEHPVVDSFQEEAPANAVVSESEGTNNVDEEVPLRDKHDEDVDEETRTNADNFEEVSGEMPLHLKIKLGDDIHILVTVRLSIKLRGVASTYT